MYTIAKEFRFEASHVLDQLPKGHKCSRLHGHSYRVVIILQSANLNTESFVIDYGDLIAFRNLVDHLDHRHLNDIFRCVPSTVENIAEWFFMQAKEYYPELIGIRVYETATTWGEYRED